METLATSVTRFFLQKHYIEPDQAEWFQYGLIRRMIGSLTFLLLLPIGAIFVGWIGSFLYLYSFRFLRTRTGGYHAKTPHGCLLTSLGTMFAALTLAKNLYSPLLIGAVLFAAALCIFVLAPANNASLHLTAMKSPAIQPRAWLLPCWYCPHWEPAVVHLCCHWQVVWQSRCWRSLSCSYWQIWGLARSNALCRHLII